MIFSTSQHTVRLGAFALGALLTFGLSNAALAQWKWKDKSGHVQYSDLPPPSTVGEQDILQRPPGSARAAPVNTTMTPAASAPSTAASGPSQAVEPELEAKRRKAEEEKAKAAKAEEDKNKAAKAENCQRAKAQLRALDDGMRMARVNDKGEREVLDDKARGEESKRARDVIGSDCK